ncbi:MAG: hypothetical protein HT580_01760 [Dechloromonas sp.]|nr:MAG: hypothetical protein HT580_01760 [Dechloromonas sp.]
MQRNMQWSYPNHHASLRHTLAHAARGTIVEVGLIVEEKQQEEIPQDPFRRYLGQEE